MQREITVGNAKQQRKLALIQTIVNAATREAATREAATREAVLDTGEPETQGSPSGLSNPVSEIVSLLFAPAEDPCLMQHSAPVRFFKVDFFPLWSRGPSGAIATPAAREPILQNSCRVLEQPFIFRAFCANVESYLRLMEGPIH